MQPHGPKHARPPFPSPTPGVYSNSCPLSWWCHPAISSSVVPFPSCLQSFPASGSFQMSQLFTSGSQSIGVSASTSVLPVNTQDWSPLGWTGWISLQSIFQFDGLQVGLPRWHSGKESACQCRRCRTHGFDSWVKKVPWRRKWQPTPVFSLENSADRGAWRAIAHRVTKSQT